MSVELLQALSLVSFIASGVLFLVGIALFFLFDVPKLIGDISGRTAKKAIENIRQKNEETGNKAYKPSVVNATRGKITAKMSNSGRLMNQTEDLPVSAGTEKIFVGSQQTSQETTVLGGNETTVLDSQRNETTVLVSAANETTVLVQETPEVVAETTILQSSVPIASSVPAAGTVTVEVEMSYTSSTEIIE